MTILRKHQKTSYTNIDNEALDAPLSLAAKGLIAFIMRKPDGWDISAQGLAHECLEGEKAIRTIMRELAAAGFLMRTRERGDKGQMRTVTVVADYPAFAHFGTTESRLLGYVPKDKAADPASTDPTATEGSAADTSAQGASIQLLSTTTKDLSPQPKPAPKHRQPSGPHQQMVDAFVEATEDYEPNARHNFGETGKWAKDILARGFTVGDMLYTFHALKTEKFWQGKHLKMATVAEQISAKVAQRDHLSKPKGQGSKVKEVVFDWE